MHRLLVACLSVIFAFIAMFFLATPVSAANRYWVGGSDGANINDTANWAATQEACGVGGGASVPGASDIAFFTSSCTNGATINAAWSVQGINLNSGYSGTITQGSGITVTIGSFGYTQAGGTFTGSNAAISSSTTFTLSGGTFTSTSGTLSLVTNFTISGGTFNHNNGNITVNGSTGISTWSCNNAVFNTVTVAKNGYGITVGSDCTIPIAGTNPSLVVGTGGDSVVNNGTINITGNPTFSNNYVQNTGAILNISGTSATFSTSLTLNGGSFTGNVTAISVGASLNNTGNVLPNDLALTFTSTAGGTITCGTADFSSVTINKTGNNIFTVQSDCTFPIAGTNPTTGSHITNNGEIIITGNWTHSGNFTSSAGSVSVSGTSMSFTNLTLSGGTFLGNITDVTISSSLNNSGNVLPDNLNITFTSTTGGTLTCGTATFASITINKSGNNTFTIQNDCSLPLAGTNPTSGGNIVNNGTIQVTGSWNNSGSYTSNTGAVLTVTGDSIVLGESLTLNGGAFPQNITTLTVGRTFSNVGNLLPNNIDLTLNGDNSGNIHCGTANFASITFNKTSNITPISDCTTVDLSHVSSTSTVINPSSAYVFDITGNLEKSSTASFGGSNLTLRFSGAGTQTVNAAATYLPTPIIINKSSGTVQLDADFVTSQACTLTAGTLNANGKTLYCIGGFTVASGATIQLTGNDFISPTLTSGSTVRIVGDGDSTSDTFPLPNWSYPHLTISMSDSNDAVSVSDSLTTNLIGYWKMDEGSGSTVDDSSNNNNTGSLTNATFSSTVPTTVFSNPFAASLEATGDYINVGNNLNLAQNKSVISVSAWIRMSNVSGTKDVFGLSTGNNSANDRINVQMVGDELRCQGRAGDAEATQIVTTNAANLAAGFWYLVTCNFDFTNDTITPYINGIQYTTNGTVSFTASSTSDTASLTSAIGIDQDKAGNDFNGFIDEVRVYDRLLSKPEIGYLIVGRDSTEISTLTVSGNYSQTSGTVNSPSIMNIAGNFSQTGGIFSHNNGTIVLNGTDQTIAGSTTFYNLTKSVSSARTLTFTAGTTQTIEGTTTLTGTSGNLLSLRSSSDGSQWSFDPQGSRSISYVDVKDSNNTNATTISTAGNNITDSGNNTNWGFDSSAPDISLTAISPDPGTDTTPTLTGTANEAVGTVTDVEFQMDSTAGSWTNCTADDGTFDEATEPFTCQVVSAVSEGSHTIYVRASDSNGFTTENASAATDTFYVDTTAPTTPGTPSTTTPTSDTTPTWSWTASTDTDGSGLATPAYTVEWSQSLDFTSGVSSDTANTNSFTHSSPLSEGTWYFRVMATDAATNTSSYSSNGSVVIDLTNPTTPGTPSTSTPTNDTSPTWSWTAGSDALSGIAHYAWRITTSLGAAVTNGTTSALSVTANLAEGAYNFFIKSVDNAGNESAEVSGDVTVDTSAPSISLTAFSPDPTTDNTPTLTGTASDTGTALTAIEYQVDSGSWSTCTADDGTINESSEAFSCTVATLSDGNHTINVRARDSAANTTSGGGLGSDTLTVDTSGPTTPGTPSSSSDTDDFTPTWSWAVSTDAGVGLATSETYTFEWSQSSSFSSGVTTTTLDAADCSGGTCSFTHTSDLAEATWYARVKAIDSLDNESSYSSTGTHIVSLAPLDSTAPTGSISIDESYTKTNSITAAISASDDTDTVSSIQMMVATSSDFSGSSWEAYSVSKSVTLSSGDGTKTVYVKFKDSYGNTSNIYSDSIVFDATAPQDFDTREPSDNTFTNEKYPTFKFKVSSDSTSGLNKYTVLLNGESFIGDINPNDPGGNHIREDNIKKVVYDGDYITVNKKFEIKDGEYTWKILATDRAGNTKETGSKKLTIETIKPVLQLNSIDQQESLVKSTSTGDTVILVSSTKPTFTGVADALSTVTLDLNTQLEMCSTKSEENSLWKCTPDEEIPIGNHILNITAKDKAGNVTKLPSINLVVGKGALETEIIDTKVITSNQADSQNQETSKDANTDSKIKEQEKTPSTNEEVKTYDVVIRVVDKDGKPLPFTKVTLFSTPREAVTDKDGIAHFTDVEEGEHTIVVASNSQVGEQKISVGGTDNVERYEYTIAIEETNPFLNPWVAMTIGMLVAITLLAVVLFLKEKRKT